MHTLTQYNEPGNLNDMNMSAGNGDFNGDYCYMNSCTGYESKNHKPIGYTKKRDEISNNRYLRENIALLDGVSIDDMLPASALNQYINME